MTAVQLALLCAVVPLLGEVILPLGQTFSTHKFDDDRYLDFEIFNAMKALTRFSGPEALVKIVAYGAAFMLLFDHSLLAAPIVVGIAAINLFHLAPRKLDRFYGR